MVTIRVENGEESGDTIQPTQPNPRQGEPLDGRIGSAHNPQWSSLATFNIGVGCKHVQV